jgi:membrane protein
MTSDDNHDIIYEAHGTEIQTNAGGGRRYRKHFKHFRWCDIQSLLGESFGNWNRHNDTRLGASLAFYSLLSLAPLVLVLVSIAGLVFGHRAAASAIVRDARATIGPAGADIIRQFLLGSHKASQGIFASVAGLITLLFSASGVLIELHDTLNTVWEIPGPNISGLHYFVAYIKQRLFSFAMVLAIGFLLIISLAITTLISSFVVISGVFAAIYKIVPDVHLEWRDVILGGAVTSLLFTLGKLILGIYLGRASYRSMYGAAASIVVAIAWVYYSGQIFFLGAEFTRSFARRYGSQPKQHPKEMVRLSSDTVPEAQPQILAPPKERV